MRSREWGSRWLAGAMMVGAVVVASGCAQEVGDIDRTGPNRLSKTDFDGGVWVMRQTIADVPSTNAFFFTGLSTGAEKIRWEITEGALIGYRSYELVPGASEDANLQGPNDTQVTAGLGEGHTPDEFKGSPVVAYAITDHFDVRRSYNSSTGEQSNVIEENRERYWNSRDFMRVDWSNNQLSNINLFDTAAEIQYQHYYGDEDPNAQTFRIERDAAGRAVYMEFTTKAIILPSYACYYYYEADCGPTEVEIVNSFVRAPEVDEETYEPVVYDDHDMFKFGYFRQERSTYDDKRGLRRSGQIFLPTRHNIWETAYDADRNLIPLKDRTPKPVIYYMNPAMPAELDAYNKTIEAEWDKAYRQAVALAKELPLDQVPQMYYVCHNPVQAGDGEACGEEGFTVGVGDLRYNHVYWVDDPQLQGPLGYGPNAADPETGEVYSGTAYVYGAGVDTTATYALDLVKFVLACRADEGSATCREHREAVMAGADVRSDVLGRLRQGADPRASVSAKSPELANMPVPGDFRELLGPELKAKVSFAQENPRPYDPGFEQRRSDEIKRQGYDLMLMDDATVREMSGGRYATLAEVPADELDAMRPASWLTPGRIKAYGEQRASWFAKRNIMTQQALVEGELLGLVERMVAEVDAKGLKPGEADEFMWQRLRGLIYQGVMLHEIGHTLGLRHNFQGSYDSLNFHAPYWKLRKENLRAVNTVSDLFEVSANTDNQLAGRVVDESGAVVEQLDAGIAEYQFSTVMDYGHHTWADTQGVGKYDVAAIVYAYTAGYQGKTKDGKAEKERGYVQVFSDEAFSDPTSGADAADLIRAFDDRGSLAYTGLLEGFHYTTVATLFGDVENIDRRSWMPYEEVLAAREAEDPNRPVEVPFMFCTDDWVGVDSSCHRWDAGADPYEQAIHAVRRYRDYYPLSNFARDSLYFNPYNKVSNTYSRIFSLLNNIYQQLFFAGDYDGIQSTYRWMAANMGLNLVAEVLMTPNYGNHVLDRDGVLIHCFDSDSVEFERDGRTVTTQALCYGDDDLRVDQAIDMEVPMGVGRYPFNRYDYDRGYAYYNYPTESGHFYDYLAGIIAMVSNQATVLGVDIDADTLSYSLPFNLVFDTQLTRLFNAIWLEHPQDFGPRVVMADGSFVNRPLSAVSFSSISVDPETGSVLNNDNVPDEMGEAIAIRPYHTWGSRLYSLLYGMAFFSSNLSLEFADNNKVFRLGSGEALEVADGFTLVQCTDPLNGQSYGALRNDTSVNQSAAAEVVERCNEQVEAYQAARARLDFDGAQRYQQDFENTISYINLMRSYYESFGRL